LTQLSDFLVAVVAFDLKLSDCHWSLTEIAFVGLGIAESLREYCKRRTDNLGVLALEGILEPAGRAVEPTVAVLEAIDEIVGVLALPSVIKGESL